MPPKPAQKKPLSAPGAKKPLPKPASKPLPKANPQSKVASKPLPKANPQAPKQSSGPQSQSWLTRTTNAATSGIGNFTGAIVSAAGNGVAGAGKGAGASVTNTSRGWGDVVRDYGNSIKDVTGATGARGSSKGNPLGLSSTAGGAKAMMGSKPGATGGKGAGSNPLGL